ncbi:MAG TPA: hypothetical protein VLG67_02495 [Candidatus Saccharimonadales bacterium]|nr:hypothetical protein [Candidatus Saccharimonadales bacterium]
MKKNIKQHLGYYIAFSAVQLLGLILVILSAGNRQIQQIAILGTTIFYFIFAMVHHHLNHDLSAKIVVEYALMSCVGLSFALVAFSNI